MKGSRSNKHQLIIIDKLNNKKPSNPQNVYERERMCNFVSPQMNPHSTHSLQLSIYNIYDEHCDGAVLLPILEYSLL